MNEGAGHYPLVAVVTPVYNGSPYFERTVACVQAQTYPNLVHVVLDNASTDDTPRVIAQAQGGRVPILTQRNSSVLPQVENWNAALAMTPAEAKYVKFLCADDLIRADAIERMVGIAEAHENINFVTAMDVFDDWIKQPEFEQADRVYDGRAVMRDLLSGAISWFPFPHIFFRVTPARLNNPFDPATLPAPDADFTMRLLLDGDMGYVSEPLFYTRKHAASATTLMGGDCLFIITGLERLKRYGSRVFPPHTYERIGRNSMRLLLRHVLAWKATGQSDVANQTLQSLSKLGFEPSLMDYFIAIVTWPSHKLRRTARETLQRVISPPARLREPDFVNSLKIRAAGDARFASGGLHTGVAR